MYCGAVGANNTPSEMCIRDSKPGWIDFNAGVILENEPMEKTCESFVDYIIRVASGEFVNNEKKGYKEIAIFKTGYLFGLLM